LTTTGLAPSTSLVSLSTLPPISCRKRTRLPEYWEDARGRSCRRGSASRGRGCC
jgi:hypothetical protein